MPKAREWKAWGGYNHIFVHTAGGCDICGDSKYPCDDEYECIVCGKRIKLLSTREGHFETPTTFYGKSVCEEKEFEKAKKNKIYKYQRIGELNN